MRKRYMPGGVVAKLMLAALLGLSFWAYSGVINAENDDPTLNDNVYDEGRTIGRLAQAPTAPATPPVRPDASNAGGAIIREKDGVTSKDVAKDAGVTVKTPAAAEKPLDVAGARAKVEQYFNSLTTLQAEFSQSVTGEAFASEGTFYLKRPRQFLWQYDTPVRQKIVSTGTTTYYVDQSSSSGKDGQVTQLPSNAGLGRIFNVRELSLSRAGIEVVEARETAGTLRVLLKIAKPSAAEDQAGLKQAWLTFDKLDGGKLELRKIEALDTLQATTTVTFSDIRHGLALDGKMFQYTPGVYKGGNN